MKYPTSKQLGLSASLLALAISSAHAENNPEQEERMEEVVVTATTTEHDLFTAPASVTLVSGEELRSRAYATIADALKETTGLSLQSSAYGRQDIRIRGMESQYSLILINGKRTSSSNALIRGNDFDLSSFPMASIERIEVIRGPMSSLYGSDAMGGVINIITKKVSVASVNAEENSMNGQRPFSTLASWQGSVGTEYTSMQEGEGGDQQRTSVYASGVLIPNTLSTTITLEQSKRDAWKPFDGIYTPLDGLEKTDKTSANIDIDYTINSDQSLALSIASSQDDRVAQWARGPSLATTEQDIERLAINISHDANWAWGQSRVKVLRENIDLTDVSSAYAPDTRTTGGTAIAEQNNTVADVLVNSEFNGNLISIGAQVRQAKLKSDRDLPQGDSVIESAIFAQDEIFLGDLAITAGLRAENHEDYGNHLSPRIYAVYEATEGFVVKGGVGTGFKAPDLVQTSPDYTLLSCGGACYLTGNSDLEPETNISYEMSVAFQQANFGLSTGLFYNEVKDKLYRDTSVAVGSFNTLPTIQYINLEEATYEGAELEVWYDLTSNVNLTANYTYTDAQDTSNDVRLQYVPLQQASVKVNWSPVEKSNTFINLRYIGQQEIRTGTAPSYHVLDIGGKFQAYKGINLKLGINNVQNLKLHEENDVFAPGSSYVEQGRSVYAGINYAF